MQNQNQNILDTDVPNINVPLLKPKKYIKEKKMPKITKADKLKKKK